MAKHRLRDILACSICLGMLGYILFAASGFVLAQVHISSSVQAGTETTIEVPGSGRTTLYLFGPGVASKRNVERGTIRISGDELKSTGRYAAIVDGRSTLIFVTAAPLDKIAFLAHPSRVPTNASNAISGTAVLFDRFQNLVLAPTPVSFRLAVEGNTGEERHATANDGIAWVQMNSGKHGGAAQFTASAADLQVRRVVQQVAADPCAIRMRASPAPDGNILVETDPIRDCSGNAVPDGTIVTFTSVDASGRSTVDARIKQGFARAELPQSPGATLTVAAGVVLGNEIRWGAGQ
jgi:hypothetical protein